MNKWTLKPAITGDASKQRWSQRVKQIAIFIVVLLSSAMVAMTQWSIRLASKTRMARLGKI